MSKLHQMDRKSLTSFAIVSVIHSSWHRFQCRSCSSALCLLNDTFCRSLRFWDCHGQSLFVSAPFFIKMSCNRLFSPIGRPGSWNKTKFAAFTLALLCSNLFSLYNLVVDAVRIDDKGNLLALGKRCMVLSASNGDLLTDIAATTAMKAQVHSALFIWAIYQGLAL